MCSAVRLSESLGPPTAGLFFKQLEEHRLGRRSLPDRGRARSAHSPPPRPWALPLLFFLFCFVGSLSLSLNALLLRSPLLALPSLVSRWSQRHRCLLLVFGVCSCPVVLHFSHFSISSTVAKRCFSNVVNICPMFPLFFAQPFSCVPSCCFNKESRFFFHWFSRFHSSSSSLPFPLMACLSPLLSSVPRWTPRFFCSCVPFLRWLRALRVSQCSPSKVGELLSWFRPSFGTSSLLPCLELSPAPPRPRRPRRRLAVVGVVPFDAGYLLLLGSLLRQRSGRGLRHSARRKRRHPSSRSTLSPGQCPCSPCRRPCSLSNPPSWPCPPQLP